MEREVDVEGLSGDLSCIIGLSCSKEAVFKASLCNATEMFSSVEKYFITD
jgi:hypothetical protein